MFTLFNLKIQMWGTKKYRGRKMNDEFNLYMSFCQIMGFSQWSSRNLYSVTQYRNRFFTYEYVVKSDPQEQKANVIYTMYSRPFELTSCPIRVVICDTPWTRSNGWNFWVSDSWDLYVKYFSRKNSLVRGPFHFKYW